MRLFCVISLIFLFIISGCATQRLVDFTFMSNKNIGSKIDIPSGDDLPIVEGKSVLKTYFIFPSGKGPSISHALNEALKAGKGNAMIDGNIEVFSNMYFPFIYMEQGYIVTGKVISTSEQ
jgi:hypothetical protein